MIKIGANSVLFAGFDLETAMRHIHLAGYDGIELAAIKGSEHLELENWQAQVNQIKELSQQYELELLAMEVASLEEERLMPAFAAGAEIGIPVVNIGSGGQSDVEEDLVRQVELVATMAERAQEHGLTLCVKPHVGACIYNTPTILRAMEMVDSPACGINMDPSHIHRAGENPVESFPKVADRVKHVHIRDCAVPQGGPGTPETQACGRGDIDLFGFIRVLHESGNDLSADLEVIGASGYDLGQVTTIAAESRGYLHACLRACGAR